MLNPSGTSEPDGVKSCNPASAGGRRDLARGARRVAAMGGPVPCRRRQRDRPDAAGGGDLLQRTAVGPSDRWVALGGFLAGIAIMYAMALVQA